MKNLIQLLLLRLLFSGCGEQSQMADGVTKVMFSHENNSRVTLVNGVMIYAQNTQTGQVHSAGGSSLNAFEDTMILPNGPYKFFALGYDTGSQPIQSTFYCGVANNNQNVQLSGGTTTITMTLGAASAGPCPDVFGTNASFLDGGPPITLKLFQIKTCSADFNVSTTSSNCTSHSPSYYLQVSLLKTIPGQPAEPLLKGCFNANAVISSLKLPITATFKILIRKFTSSDCTTGGSSNQILINNGLENITVLSGSTTSMSQNIGSNPVQLYISDTIL